ncbi:Non-hem dioxygenase N-terminal domain [Dillenia turbinata]|uniref:Non-hem dioxygenase N-terminal domain n=1 Tax=Dillenia turbinata TaxID=194707 RepID=A0AAN8YTP0_9MAGN
MAISTSEIPLDFRAPPPSPIASGRKSSVQNDDIVNHGIHGEIVKSAMESAKGVFELPKEKKSLVNKKVLEGGFGFEDKEDEEEQEEEEETETERREREEFIWGREEDESLKVALEGIWPRG